MLPIYEAIDIIGSIPANAGHTEPWVVLANTPKGLRSFYVKLYTTEQIERNHSVTSEVICNVLASEFDLNVPEAAFIDIPDSLLFKIPPKLQLLYDRADSRLKFGTAEIKGVNIAIGGLAKNNYTKRIEIDLLYAFDNLILNGDRGQQKTNLLIGKEAWLIDHEYALNPSDISNMDWDNFQIEQKFTKYHLFYSYLKRGTRSKKQNYFDEFIEYSRNLNLNNLDVYFQQLSREGYVSNRTIITDWLKQVKQNLPIFVDYLKGSLE